MLKINGKYYSIAKPKIIGRVVTDFPLEEKEICDHLKERNYRLIIMKGRVNMSKKIAICSTSSSPSSPVDERFGRCTCFMIFDPETKEYKPLSNTGNEAAHGAGTGAVQALIKRNVDVVISHRVGPKAYVALEQAKIKIFSGVAGKTVEAALQSYQDGELQELLAPNN